MKVGDYVGYANSWCDMNGLEPAGIIIDVDIETDICEMGESWAYVLMHDGKIQWFDIQSLEVMFEQQD